MAEWSCHSRKLANPINLSDLQNGHVLEFNKAGEDYIETYDADHDYDLDEVSKFSKLDLLESDESGSTLGKYKRDMVAVPYGPQQSQDGKLMKRIKEKGFGESPVAGSFVKVHYMYYAELQEIPIDITYLRKSFPEKFQLGSKTLIPGLEYAILSMKKGEKADFYASYELCFGELGCPPRIPAKADLLFEVHLVSFSSEIDLKTSGDLESDALVKNQAEEPAFEKVLKRAQEMGASGKIAFNERNLLGALRRYREAVKLLLNTQVMNLEEQRTLEEYLCKMYRNLMVCYNRNGEYKRSCDCANKALQFANFHATRDMKLFFLWGKALNAIQEWKSAVSKLKTALKLATKNSEKAEIEKEILMAETKNTKYEKEQRERCQKMFSARVPYAEDEEVRPATIRELDTSEDDPLAQFSDLMRINLSEFKMSSTAEREVLGETAEFNREEIEVIKSLARTMGLVCTIDREIVLTKTY